MAFDYAKLQQKIINSECDVYAKIALILKSEEFENALQEYLESCIEYGRISRATISLKFSPKTVNSENLCCDLYFGYDDKKFKLWTISFYIPYVAYKNVEKGWRAVEEKISSLRLPFKPDENSIIFSGSATTKNYRHTLVIELDKMCKRD